MQWEGDEEEGEKLEVGVLGKIGNTKQLQINQSYQPYFDAGRGGMPFKTVIFDKIKEQGSFEPIFILVMLKLPFRVTTVPDF